ncbi:ATP-dependent helicase HrpB [Leptospira ilyithenensis]|uniref:ATP-dependent helicase HrpB n=1 Tax=Leptospira ilyithenensis TaxID=2484901 RepID=A0A4R9LY32_9LEPT|nr:ATP-dependent helicase HrpB [Leptospira ilyithenensis]TGN14681.1 ATP-dependent helicase HrpB [Leptospira ilyithenensis]
MQNTSERYPIQDNLDDILDSLQKNNLTLLEAPPGSGKTTVLPIEILRSGKFEKKILILEPRRLAARNAAIRMSQVLGEEVGNTVGYRIRFESKISKDTKLELVTDGILSKMLVEDPELSDYGLVVFDEFHERNLDSDFCFALCRRSTEIFRPDLKILVMSATLEGTDWGTKGVRANQIQAKGRMFPVTIRYTGSSPRRVTDRIGELVPQILSQSEGDVLVFFSGVSEIYTAERILNDNFANKGISNVLILKLYGEMRLENQVEIFLPPKPGQRKLILSTNIAETSLTIPGVKLVVDTGFCKRMIFDPRSGLSRLEKKRISLNSAKQRSGRAGRESEGTAIRLWSEEEEKDFPVSHPPEILEADVSGLVLLSKKWGEELNDLPLLDKPSLGVIRESISILQVLGLLDRKEKITNLGISALRLPLSTRLSGMCCMFNGSDLPLAELSALLSEKDILGHSETNLRFLSRWEAWQKGNVSNFGLKSRIEQSIRQIEKILNDLPKKPKQNLSIQGALSFAFPDRIAKRRTADSNKYKLFNGKGAILADTGGMHLPEWILVLDSDGDGTEAKVRLYCELNEEEILKLHFEKISEHLSSVIEETERKTKLIRFVQNKFLGEIVLSRSTKPTKFSKEEKGEAVVSFWKKEFFYPYFEKDDKISSFLNRIRILKESGFSFPEFSEEKLQEEIRSWLLPFYSLESASLDPYKPDFLQALSSRLTYSESEVLKKETPTHLTVPSGSTIPIEYFREGASISVKLQEMFGMRKVPKIAGGKVEILLHLLSPARRPVQVTRDLENFWDVTYHEVKKELKGKYPRHPWPDSPWEAIPTSRTKNRG